MSQDTPPSTLVKAGESARARRTGLSMNGKQGQLAYYGMQGLQPETDVCRELQASVMCCVNTMPGQCRPQNPKHLLHMQVGHF